MPWARIGNRRSWQRERHLGAELRDPLGNVLGGLLGRLLGSPLADALGAGLSGDFRLCRPHIPLTHAEAIPAFDQIEMDMALVIAIGSRSEHRREAPAGTVTYLVTEFFRGLYICQAQGSSIGESERAQIDSIGLSMLAELGACHAITTTAFESIVGFDGA